jgi:hypothetical protein
MANSQVMIALLFGDKLNSGKLEFGLAVSPSLTNITNIDGEARPGLTLGLYFNFKISEKFYIYAEGIAKGALGTKNLLPYSTGNDTLDQIFADGKVEREINSFGMPLMARYRIRKNLFVDGGVQANWMTKCIDKFDADVDGNDIDYTIKVNDQISTLDFGLTAGVHYKFKDDRKSMGVGVRYYQGLTDIMKYAEGNQSNTAWNFMLTIPVGAGKSSSSTSGKNAKKGK